MTHDELTPRGTRHCRGCESGDLASVLDLGRQPLSNEMGDSPDESLPAFPLHLRICRNCGLGQVGEFVLPERIFGDDYPYLSSTSATWVEHARRYAAQVSSELGLDAGDLVLEVASNDGYLLSAFQNLGIRVLGVEPARNVAELAVAAGVPTVNRFFGRTAAEEIVAEHGHPRLVVANNVMAHVPDLDDFTAGFAVLCDDDTVVTVENPSLVNLLLEGQFDTIYHEHFSYLTAHAVSRVVARHGLALVHVEQLPTHGGSNRYWIHRAGTAPVEDSVARTVEAELAGGLLRDEVWTRFREDSLGAVHGLRAWLDECRDAGRTVAGYGAAAKGNTLLNAADGAPQDLAYVVDGSPEKQGRFLPGSRVPVLAPARLAAGRPDDVLLFPWNLAQELVPLVREQLPEASVWVAVPTMTRLA